MRQPKGSPKLTQARAEKAVDKITAPLGNLREIKHMSDQLLKELGPRNTNNLYLHDDLVAVGVLASLLANQMATLIAAVETVSWR